MLVMGYYSEKTGGPCEDPIMEPLIAKQIRTAVAAEIERIERPLQAELDAITSGATTPRFIGLNPAGLLSEVISLVRSRRGDSVAAPSPEPSAEKEE